MTNTRPTLLLVDDEPDLLLSLQGLLRQEFDLHIANGGQAALETIQSHTIQIVMSDQRMPGMSGDELLTQITEQSPNTVCILLTGYADIQDVIRALNSGGLFRYLTKPWDLDELMEVLQLAVERYRQTIARIDRHQQTQKFTDDVVAFLQSLPESDQIANLIQRGITLPMSEGDPR